MLDGFITFLIIGTIAMLAVVIWSAIQNSRQPVKRVHAVTLRRRMRDYSIDVPANPLPMLLNIFGRRWFGRSPNRISNKHVAQLSGEVTLAESVDYFITFGVEGNEVELIVPEGVFADVQDGVWGTLIYQGEIFKHFMPDQQVQQDTTKHIPPKPPTPLAIL